MTNLHGCCLLTQNQLLSYSTSCLALLSNVKVNFWNFARRKIEKETKLWHIFGKKSFSIMNEFLIFNHLPCPQGVAY